MSLHTQQKKQVDENNQMDQDLFDIMKIHNYLNYIRPEYLSLQIKKWIEYIHVFLFFYLFWTIKKLKCDKEKRNSNVVKS